MSFHSQDSWSFQSTACCLTSASFFWAPRPPAKGGGPRGLRWNQEAHRWQPDPIQALTSEGVAPFPCWASERPQRMSLSKASVVSLFQAWKESLPSPTQPGSINCMDSGMPGSPTAHPQLQRPGSRGHPRAARGHQDLAEPEVEVSAGPGVIWQHREVAAEQVQPHAFRGQDLTQDPRGT